MNAIGGVQAFLPEHQALHPLSANDVGLHDFFHIPWPHVSVPHRLGINHDVRPMLALVKASRLVGANSPLQAQDGKLLLEQFMQLCSSLGVAAPSRMPRRAHVSTDKDMALKFRHQFILQGFLTVPAGGRRPDA
jgi:hypothetical protein